MSTSGRWRLTTMKPAVAIDYPMPMFLRLAWIPSLLRIFHWHLRILYLGDVTVGPRQIEGKQEEASRRLCGRSRRVGRPLRIDQT